MIHQYNLTNGKFIHLQNSKIEINSLTIKNGKIHAINSTHNSFQNIDLKGSTLIPGFTDAHFHLKNFGKRLEQLQLKGVDSPKKIAEMVLEKSTELPQGTWITGFGWDQTRWANPEFPNSTLLNQIQNHPVMLTRIDGHSIWVNDVAVKLGGYDVNNFTSPEGGKIINDCILLDNAMNPIWDAQPDDSFQDVKRWIKMAAHTARRRGITNVHDAWQDADTVRAIQELIVEGEFPIRCYGMLASSDATLLTSFFENGHYESELYTIRSVKAFIDGALGSRGAALLEPYSDDHCNCGLILISHEEFTELAHKCNDANFQLCTHAIGDRGNKMVLDIYGNTINSTPNHRWRIEHAQMVRDEDIPRFAEHEILPSMQPSHCTSDMRWMDERIGTHRSPRISRWQSFVDAGLPIPGGSDCPIEDGEPLFEYFAAVTRQDHNGWPKNGWQSQEKLNRIDALKMFTSWAAYGEFAEHKRGQLRVGYDADFTILSQDITKCETSEILKIDVYGAAINGTLTLSIP
ncbi:MAG: amidohydrolase [Candidatus Marinimicrobia bacterium]|nr:amidohydrolase [Candidatus Neomarinimicrobiota bacterium]